MDRTIGRYEIRDELGRGGMGVVYLVHDPRLDRLAALKLMDRQLSNDPKFAARFEREAKTVASLEHGAIVPLHDFGEANGWLYLVMRYMEGGTLRDLIADSPLTPEQAYHVVRRIGAALDKAHDKHVIHRDLKPANILLDEDQSAYLGDFGIVKMAVGDTEYLTETGQTIGTFAYMSPEQIMGENLSNRSDIYALGLVLYEMLAGSHPFGDVATSGAMAVAQTTRPIPDISVANPELPVGCQAVIEKAMAKDPAARYASGREMAAALSEALSSEQAAEAKEAPKTASVALASATPESSPASPLRDEPAERPQTGQPVAPPVQPQPESAAATGARVAQKPDTAIPEPEEPFSANENRVAPVSPLPEWVVMLAGFLTIGTGLAIYSGLFLGYWPFQDVMVIYWLGIGLVMGANLLSKPSDRRWKAAVAFLAIVTAVGWLMSG